MRLFAIVLLLVVGLGGFARAETVLADPKPDFENPRKIMLQLTSAARPSRKNRGQSGSGLHYCVIQHVEASGEVLVGGRAAVNPAQAVAQGRGHGRHGRAVIFPMFVSP